MDCYRAFYTHSFSFMFCLFLSREKDKFLSHDIFSCILSYTIICNLAHELFFFGPRACQICISYGLTLILSEDLHTHAFEVGDNYVQDISLAYWVLNTLYTW
jgi:hypothetical protein